MRTARESRTRSVSVSILSGDSSPSGKAPFRQFDSGILGHAGLTSRSSISSIIEASSAFACAFFVASQDSIMLVLQNQSLYDA